MPYLVNDPSERIDHIPRPLLHALRKAILAPSTAENTVTVSGILSASLHNPHRSTAILAQGEAIWPLNLCHLLQEKVFLDSLTELKQGRRTRASIQPVSKRKDASVSASASCDDIPMSQWCDVVRVGMQEIVRQTDSGMLAIDEFLERRRKQGAREMIQYRMLNFLFLNDDLLNAEEVG